jgi:hypothetical protein
MQAEKTDHLKDALSARRGKGLEIIIGLGPHGDYEGGVASDDQRKIESGHGDLAPPPVASGDQEAPMESGAGLHAPHPEGVIAGQHEMGPGDVPTSDDARAHFSQNMSEHDIKDIANRKPRSLAERARQYAFSKK